MKSPVILSHVISVDGHLWEVSGSNGNKHIVAHDWDGWMCTCEDHFYRKRFCKHMRVCAESESATSNTNVGATSHTLDMGVVDNGCY